MPKEQDNIVDKVIINQGISVDFKYWVYELATQKELCQASIIASTHDMPVMSKWLEKVRLAKEAEEEGDEMLKKKYDMQAYYIWWGYKKGIKEEK